MKCKKVAINFIIILLILNVVFLPSSYASTADDIFEAGDNFLSKGQKEDTVINTTQLKTVSSTIYKVLLTIAICISAIIGAVLGVQFIIGSVEGKAKVSEALIPYIVGCIVVFGAFAIWSIIVNFGNASLEGNISSSGGSTTHTSSSGGSTTHTSSSGETHGGSHGKF